MGLASFERRLERLVEGAFAKAFRSGLQPVEVGRRLTREMDLRRTVAPRGTLAPNRFDVRLSRGDRDRFLPIEDELISELISVARDHARSEGYQFLGPVSISLDPDDTLSSGTMRVRGEMVQAAADAGVAARSAAGPRAGAAARPTTERAPSRFSPAGAASPSPGAVLVLPDGREIAVGDRPVVMGRMPGCEIFLADPNVSRRHAEVRPAGGGWAVADLGSTNGTKVNGVRISGSEGLRPGDEIRVGATSLRFEAD
ncbi:MAG: DUF3662 and FHA domain-containing protein [Actinomycetota bacterium]|nr:DUF3662 and FHA domain-containing protein [Actinomycetota bacterium]